MIKLFGRNFYTEKDIAVLTGKTDLQVDVKYDYAYLQAQIDSDTKIIQQQAREIEQLTEQLDNRETIYNLAVAQIREMQEHLDSSVQAMIGTAEEIEEATQKIDELQAELDALRQQQIMLSTTTPTKKARPVQRTRGPKI